MASRIPDHASRISATIWAVMFVAAGAANVLVNWADARKQAGHFEFWPVLIDEASSISVSLLLLPCLLTACRRWPLTLANWPRRLPPYLAGSMAWTLLHVGGMVALRKLAYLPLGEVYHYGPWLTNLVYEYDKDMQTYLLIVTIAHSFDWYVRLRQGEAHALSTPDIGVPSVPESTPGRPQRFLVRKLGREFLIATDDIEWLDANGNYVNLHLAGRAYPLRSTIGGIEAQLDPARFIRVHRSHIVNVCFLASIEPTDSGDARIHMKDGIAIACSRRYREALRQGISVNASP